MNVGTDLIKTPTPNQQGIPSVILMVDRKQFRRAVGLLVALSFLDSPPSERFDTPINLDGDRMNNHVDNLAWRPRWFALKYHAQFKKEVSFGFDAPLHLIQTGEHFESVRDCAMKYGLLEKEIIMAAHTKTPVFPTWQEFELVSQ